MSLNNVDSNNGVLECVGSDGVAVSEDRIKQTLVSISESTTADLLTTSTPISDGDKLIIIKDDNSINEIVASGVLVSSDTTPVDLIPIHTDTSDPTVSTACSILSNFNNASVYKLFDKNSATWWNASASGEYHRLTHTITWIGKPRVVTRVVMNGYTGKYPTAYQIWGSNTGDFTGEHTVLASVTGGGINNDFNMDVIQGFKYHRFNCTHFLSNGI
ncbi:MAG: hypothetical protein GQ474_09560, partial [Sulfurimonas sp.]|nr:hypothetical protein [Sulfurimonas sp.]